MKYNDVRSIYGQIPTPVNGSLPTKFGIHVSKEVRKMNLENRMLGLGVYGLGQGVRKQLQTNQQ